jgi:transcriptional regulator with XRE-family HTH domain
MNDPRGSSKHGPKSDHEIDIEFGQWLRDLRAGSGLTIEQASQRSGVPVERLKSLELGYAEKGVTQQESKKICVAYKVDLQEFLDRAAGKETVNTH